MKQIRLAMFLLLLVLVQLACGESTVVEESVTISGTTVIDYSEDLMPEAVWVQTDEFKFRSETISAHVKTNWRGVVYAFGVPNTDKVLHEGQVLVLVINEAGNERTHYFRNNGGELEWILP